MRRGSGWVALGKFPTSLRGGPAPLPHLPSPSPFSYIGDCEISVELQKIQAGVNGIQVSGARWYCPHSCPWGGVGGSGRGKTASYRSRLRKGVVTPNRQVTIEGFVPKVTRPGSDCWVPNLRLSPRAPQPMPVSVCKVPPERRPWLREGRGSVDGVMQTPCLQTGRSRRWRQGAEWEPRLGPAGWAGRECGQLQALSPAPPGRQWGPAHGPWGAGQRWQVSVSERGPRGDHTPRRWGSCPRLASQQCVPWAFVCGMGSVRQQVWGEGRQALMEPSVPSSCRARCGSSWTPSWWTSPSWEP